MPNYEFVCKDCKKRFSVFISYADYGKKAVKCIHCDSENVQRKIGRIRFARSFDSRMTDLADPSNMEKLDEDPRALGRMMRKMSGELGEDMGPEFNEVVDRLEKGDDPETIERDMPDLGDSLTSGDD